jgi:Anti-anti-sigma regulatory factor (antagonist of anti-sigma factor)
MKLKVEVHTDGGFALIRCTGQVIFGEESDVLCEHLEQAFSRFRKCVLNMEGVDQIDAGGLGILAGCCRRARLMNCQLLLASVPKNVSEMLRLTRLSDVLQMHDSEQSAIRACWQAA